MDLVEKIHKALNESDAQFTANADLDIHVDSPDVLADGPRTIPVKFSIELEYRSWGIKSIDALVRGKQSVVVQFTKGEEEFEKEIELDFDSAEYEISNNQGVVTVDSVYLSLDANFNQTSLMVTVSK